MLVKVDKKTSSSVKVSEIFVTNVYHALKLVSMPTSEKNIGNFLSGNFEQTCFQSAGGRDHVDEGEDNSGEDKPPKRKKIKCEMKIKSLLVSI